MSKIKLNIKGKRIETFLNRLIKSNIDLLNIEYISYQEINIILYKKDYSRLKQIKTSYKIKIIRKYGIINIQDYINKNKILLFFMFLGLVFLYILSNIIFSIKVIHNNEELRNLLYQELSEYKISKYKFKQNRSELEIIKEKILKKYKDKIEWLEIEEKGTSYIVRVEERIIPNTNVDLESRNIVSKKNAIIKSIEAKSGTIEKLRGEYVNKGEVIISGNIKLNETLKDVVRAEGIIYGETWYTVDVSFPYVYQEEKYTGNIMNNIIFNFLNKEVYFMGIKYKYKNTKEKIKLSSSILPIYFSIEKNEKIEKTDYVLTCDQAIEKALIKSNKQIEDKLREKEYIMKIKVLDTNCLIEKAELKVFYAVLENITDYQIIN